MNKTGKILYVNLSDKSYHIEKIPASDLKMYLGGRGLASKKLMELTGAETDPLGPENVLIFAPGCLAGTHAPTAGRTNVLGKSPATGMYMRANMGGHWGPELRYAGYDILIIQGKASNPVYVSIMNDKVEFFTAEQIWGKDVRETTRLIKEDLGDPDYRITCIGPAGENLVRFAAVMCNVYHAAARGGLGAVMGSKNLKAVAVKGNIPNSLADNSGFVEVCQEAFDSIKDNDRCQYYYQFGTAGVVTGIGKLESFPTKNFQFGTIENSYNISGECLTDEGYLIRREACSACSIGCKRYSGTKTDRYGKSEAGGPEYETLGALGAGCCITDMDAVLKGNEICNLLGLDSISAGSVIQWAFESQEKGYLMDKTPGGQELTWGNADAMLELLEMIAYRQGIGDLLAEGVKTAAERTGGETWKWAVQAKGLEQSRVETRKAKAYALAFATNPRGPDHLYGQSMAEFGFTQEARNIIREITGSEDYANPEIIDKKPEVVCWHEETFMMTDSLGLCIRATLSTYAVNREMMHRMYVSATGIDISMDEFIEAARRVITLERSYNVKVGAGKVLDELPWRLVNEELISADGSKTINSSREMDIMLARYYKLRNWDQNGRPTRELLKSLNIEWVLDDGKN